VKTETWLFTAGAFFFAPIAIVYGFITEWKEPLGPTGLILTSAMSGLIAAYLWVTSRRIDSRPEDDPHGEIYQGAGEQGMFAPYSWSPLWLGIGAALVFAGLAVGVWLFLIGLGVTGLATVLWVFEFYRGEHAH
jgi:hypothetical protein